MFELKANVTPSYKVAVHTTNYRGSTPEEVAQRCADRIISVSDGAPPVIRDQAFAYKAQLEKTLSYYMREAIKSDRTTVCNALASAGHPELAKLVKEI
tara:strand:- start:185 stop:478 length:294 start_codon:yes stop_codon:yes gene_type:complete